MDTMYEIMYPARENPDYTHDENRNRRRENVATSRYEMMTKVNGPFHTKVLEETDCEMNIKAS